MDSKFYMAWQTTLAKGSHTRKYVMYFHAATMNRTGEIQPRESILVHLLHIGVCCTSSLHIRSAQLYKTSKVLHFESSESFDLLLETFRAVQLIFLAFLARREVNYQIRALQLKPEIGMDKHSTNIEAQMPES